LVGGALGLDAMTISTLDDLADLPARLARMSGPLLLDCRVGNDVRAAHLDWVSSPAAASAR
jgi:hypothetical protein